MTYEEAKQLVNRIRKALSTSINGFGWDPLDECLKLALAFQFNPILNNTPCECDAWQLSVLSNDLYDIVFGLQNQLTTRDIRREIRKALDVLKSFERWLDLSVEDDD